MQQTNNQATEQSHKLEKMIFLFVSVLKWFYSLSFFRLRVNTRFFCLFFLRFQAQTFFRSRGNTRFFCLMGGFRLSPTVWGQRLALLWVPFHSFHQSILWISWSHVLIIRLRWPTLERPPSGLVLVEAVVVVEVSAVPVVVVEVRTFNDGDAGGVGV